MPPRNNKKKKRKPTSSKLIKNVIEALKELQRRGHITGGDISEILKVVEKLEVKSTGYNNEQWEDLCGLRDAFCEVECKLLLMEKNNEVSIYAPKYEELKENLQKAYQAILSQKRTYGDGHIKDKCKDGIDVRAVLAKDSSKYKDHLNIVENQLHRQIGKNFVLKARDKLFNGMQIGYFNEDRIKKIRQYDKLFQDETNVKLQKIVNAIEKKYQRQELQETMEMETDDLTCANDYLAEVAKMPSRMVDKMSKKYKKVVSDNRTNLGFEVTEAKPEAHKGKKAAQRSQPSDVELLIDQIKGELEF